ncbi:unnamed protein product [Ilex paraguariensis]|uniref:Uncharacterized protein n=1 Tax=Ilex paraguariensis TaxID=185542 RepID=A0ABC8SZX6_9AQUA
MQVIVCLSDGSLYGMQAYEENRVASDEPEELQPPEKPATVKISIRESTGNDSAANGSLLEDPPASVQVKESFLELGRSAAGVGRIQQKGSVEHFGEYGGEACGYVAQLPRENLTISCQITESHTEMNVSHSVTGATVQVLKKPSRAFGALLGNTSSKRKFDPDKKEKQEVKLEQIKSTVNLPFHSFLGRDEPMQTAVKKAAKPLEVSHDGEPVAVPAGSSNLEEVMHLEGDTIVEESISDDIHATNDQLQHRVDAADSALDLDGADETTLLSDLSSSFQKCLQSLNQTRKASQLENSQECEGLLQLKPFDYEAARTRVRFGADSRGDMGVEGNEGGSRLDIGDTKKNSVIGGNLTDEAGGDFLQGRRRQAFPASGNRSATFR